MVCSIAGLVMGEMALASMKAIGLRVCVIAWAISSPTAGALIVGTIESTASTVRTSCARVDTTSSRAISERCRVRAERPSRQVTTLRPCARNTVATAAPISPGLRTPTLRQVLACPPPSSHAPWEPM
jgi:hypothetical protein